MVFEQTLGMPILSLGFIEPYNEAAVRSKRSVRLPTGATAALLGIG
jgi:hypothetical protein